MQAVYRLRDDEEFIRNVQRAAMNTEQFGIEPTHGMFGSSDWWGEIEAKRLPVRCLRGTISRVYMASMNDWPEFEIESLDGERSQWTRNVNQRGSDAMFRVGCPVELDYVLQHHRKKSWDGGAETKVVLEIRIEVPESA